MSDVEQGAVAGPVVVGVDIGGTKVALRAVRASDPTTPLAELRVDTPAADGDALVATVVDGVRLLVQESFAPSVPLSAVGVGIAGLITRQGVVRYSPNLAGVQEFPLARRLADGLGCAVVVDNDATAATLAEWQLGAGRGHDDLVGVTLGTGIGAGIVMGGQLQRGANGFAGEPGHVVIDPRGALCACGQRGCWEAYASGSALARMGAEAATDGSSPVLEALAAAGPLRGEDVAAAATAGDQGAIAVVDRFTWWVARGVANLVTVLDCSLVVVGGGLVDLGDLLFGPLGRHVDDMVMGAGHRPPVAVVPAALGASAGSTGAALAAAAAVGVPGGGGGSVG